MVEVNLAGRPIDRLVDAPPMQGRAELAQMELLTALNSAAFVVAPPLRPFVVGRMVNLTLRHGPAPESTLACVAYAIHLQQQPGGSARAAAWGRLALALAEPWLPGWRCRVLASYAALVQPWHEPLRDTLPLLRQALEIGQRVGDMLHAVWAQVTAVAVLFCQGAELSRILAEIHGALASALATSNTASAEELRSFRRAAYRLRGVQPGEELPPDPDNPVNTFTDDLNRLRGAYLLGDLGQAVASAARAAPYLDRAWTAISTVEYTFLAALTRAAEATVLPEGQRGPFLGDIAAHLQKLEVWAADCPESFRAKQLIVAGEVARLQGRPLDAAASYDGAIDAAALQESLLSDFVLASELAGRCFYRLGRARLAGPYLAAAIDGYLAWGANAKVAALEAEFADLERLRRPPALDLATASAEGAIDRVSLLDAAETISGEIVFARLLDKLMDVCLRAAGAERAVLLVEEEGRAFVRATRSVSEPTARHRTPLEDATGLPRALVEDVRRSGEPIVLTDASRHDTFGADPDIAARRVRSVLALPVQRQRRLVAVLYLENNLATSVFTSGRVRVIRLFFSSLNFLSPVRVQLVFSFEA